MMSPSSIQTHPGPATYKVPRIPRSLPRLALLLLCVVLPFLTRFFSSTTTMSGSAAFFEAIKTRRSVYTITPESTIPDAKIEEIIATAVKHAPSSFNSQSSRVRILCLIAGLS